MQHFLNNIFFLREVNMKKNKILYKYLRLVARMHQCHTRNKMGKGIENSVICYKNSKSSCVFEILVSLQKYNLPCSKNLKKFKFE